ncbi:oxysterol-binding protein 1 isoform X4 [Ceratina calcarata]|uniref:Oxysterol-binding protein 1 isoform X3 n=1 Tax=Ceratina calcarata TaxID=156304 RepID=A0AAJ7S615_9HYME|nr:oxysterol-binding protein 1 isoform X3 [Ceratina calcarata]XP_026672136.1 oxysterol-binding protein 1 isoform X4 [Ceratina calcarata]
MRGPSSLRNACEHATRIKMGDLKAQHGTQEKNGWLFKWTNYLKGYQRRWFVLSNGLLSYYRAEPTGGPKISTRRKRKAGRASENPSEMSHTCRGTISLHGALIHTVDACTFVVSNGGTQTFHIKAATEVERQQWVTALELAKAKAIQAMESEEEEEYGIRQDNDNQKPEQVTVKDLTQRLEELQACHDLLLKKGGILHRTLNELEALEPPLPELAAKVKTVNERATLFRMAASAMVTASTDYLQLAQQQEPKWKKMLQHERDQKERIEKMVEQLARQHSHLEEAAQHALPSAGTGGGHRASHTTVTTSPSEDEEDNAEFYDAQESDIFTLSIPGVSTNNSRDRTDSQGSDDGSSSEGDQTPLPLSDTATANSFRIVTDSTVATPTTVTNSDNLDNTNWESNNGSSGTRVVGSKRKRRTRVPEKPNYQLNLWSIMKNCIGKDLSKIPMPVNFSEPLSMLQRLTEDYEYADILDRAAECKDFYEQMAYVAAFTISSYSTTASRTGKPFNPLLGETYECDRVDDLGWRAISEQVSHHPPMLAQHCEGRKWRCWQEFTMASKFRGKYLQVIPLGTAHLEIDGGEHHYTWRKVTTTVHNIIVGKLWVDQSGDTDIVNHKQGIKCHLKYTPYSYFSRDSQRKVKGVVMNANNEVKWVVQGTWDSKIEIAPVISTSGTPDNPVYKTGPYILAWKRRTSVSDSEKYYNFTELACQLNEPEDGVAPTDSRFRPDQRLMENGQWDEANAEKLRLEEKQRAVRRAREHEAEKAATQGLPYEAYEPLWFKKEQDPYTDSLCYIYGGEYWECKSKGDWSRCPNIF